MRIDNEFGQFIARGLPEGGVSEPIFKFFAGKGDRFAKLVVVQVKSPMRGMGRRFLAVDLVPAARSPAATEFLGMRVKLGVPFPPLPRNLALRATPRPSFPVRPVRNAPWVRS